MSEDTTNAPESIGADAATEIKEQLKRRESFDFPQCFEDPDPNRGMAIHSNEKHEIEKRFGGSACQGLNPRFNDSLSGSITSVQEGDVQDLIVNISNLVEKLNDTNAFMNHRKQIERERDKRREHELKKERQRALELEERRLREEKLERNRVPEHTFERSTVRLDGIEVYAVVSALTVASSIACLDAYGDSADSKYWNIFYPLFDAIFMLFHIAGILTGLHSTLVFSMVTMYGRTAIGLGRDKACQVFFSKTSRQRYRAFQTFLWSLYSFLGQCIFTIVKRIPFGAVGQLLIAILLCYLGYLIIEETNDIVDKASVIFVRPLKKEQSSTNTIDSLNSPRAMSFSVFSSQVVSSRDIIRSINNKSLQENASSVMSSCRDVVIDMRSRLSRSATKKFAKAPPERHSMSSTDSSHPRQGSLEEKVRNPSVSLWGSDVQAMTFSYVEGLSDVDEDGDTSPAESDDACPSAAETNLTEASQTEPFPCNDDADDDDAITSIGNKSHDLPNFKINNNNNRKSCIANPSNGLRRRQRVNFANSNLEPSILSQLSDYELLEEDSKNSESD
uniref:Uncharacterized protein n=1 Tax=Chaetoceros debilis TaxID=122233 RepID=A0A7S3Q649_9STRA|eukprot:CAMPEP_0194120468 /NCGR_PEP_ID=MMETSP0150-20130528/43607_1 /TAXON_ID=122233 /ORGANISM="Chaetoceros debilis, Strain MM31A-1" /LENGTH=560 /DNA_ID=CAMNT_0038812593 /DNA_START=26 /DNA_END=1708 /DNA_ORIENTATION=+